LVGCGGVLLLLLLLLLLLMGRGLAEVEVVSFPTYDVGIIYFLNNQRLICLVNSVG
jgi:hypothetical protein